MYVKAFFISLIFFGFNKNSAQYSRSIAHYADVLGLAELPLPASSPKTGACDCACTGRIVSVRNSRKRNT